MDTNNAAGNGLDHFSRLEATLVTTDALPRPMSRRADDVWRHALPSDSNIDELKIDYDLDVTKFPLLNLGSPQELLPTVRYHEHLNNLENFSSATQIDCLRVAGQSAGNSFRFALLIWLQVF